MSILQELFQLHVVPIEIAAGGCARAALVAVDDHETALQQPCRDVACASRTCAAPGPPCSHISTGAARFCHRISGHRVTLPISTCSSTAIGQGPVIGELPDSTFHEGPRPVSSKTRSIARCVAITPFDMSSPRHTGQSMAAPIPEPIRVKRARSNP